MTDNTNSLDKRSGQDGMDVVVLGLSHKLAPVGVRERLAFAQCNVAEALNRLREVVPEGAILSTCNRTEVYGAAPDATAAGATLARFLSQQQRVPLHDFERHLFFRQGAEAIRHLFAVASGLDSMVLGEPQILGQVRQAMDLALEAGSAGPVLSTLFRQAVVTGKRSRTETAIGKSAASVSYVAVQLAQQTFTSLDGRTVLIVGAGKMSALTAKILAENGAARILVVSRTIAKARELADCCGGQALNFGEIGLALAQADIVICSTNAPHYILQPAMVRAAAAQRDGRRLLLIDIAVPRDIDPRVREIEGVVLYNIDDLESVVRSNLQERERVAAEVWAIVDEETVAFASRLGAQRVVPTIVALRNRAEAIRQAELVRAFRRLKGLSAAEREVIEATTGAIINKLLHAPTIQLKQSVVSGEADTLVTVARQLFGLDDGAAEDGAATTDSAIIPSLGRAVAVWGHRGARPSTEALPRQVGVRDPLAPALVGCSR